MADSTEINALPSNGMQPQSQQMPQAPQVPQNQMQQGPPPAVETQSKEQLIAPQYNPNPNTEGLQNGPLQSGQPPMPPHNQPQPQPQQQMTGNVPTTEPLSQEVVQQLIEGVQRAKETGATRLQSRDIPQDQTQFTIDQQ
jgi:hypothetical protein